jgi:hypothetical protein
MTTTLKNINTMAKTPPEAVVGINTHGYLTSSQLHSTYGAIPPLTVGQIYTTNNTAGQFTTTNSNGTGWNPNSELIRINQTNPPEIEVKGRMVINGVDLEERLKTIEKVLCIPERDVILEAKHPKLKKLYDEYIAALGKYRTFEAIKGDDDGTA